MADSFSVEGLAKSEAKIDKNEEMEQAKQKSSKQFTKKLVKGLEASDKAALKDQEKKEKDAEDRKKKVLQWKINARFEHFGEELQDVPKPSKTASLADLEEIDSLQKQKREMNGSEDRLRKMIQLAGPVIEGIWGDGSSMKILPEKMRLNLNGLGQLVHQEKFLAELQPLMDETIIEHPEIAQASLGWRWAETILTTLYCLNLYNKNPKIKAKMEEMAAKEPVIADQAPSCTAS
jgi:hypothetical protein